MEQPPARYYLLENGEVVGPFTIDQLRAMFASGRVHAGSQVCRERSREWVSATTLDLRPLPTRKPRVIGFIVAGVALMLLAIPTNELFKARGRLHIAFNEIETNSQQIEDLCAKTSWAKSFDEMMRGYEEMKSIIAKSETVALKARNDPWIVGAAKIFGDPGALDVSARVEGEATMAAKAMTDALERQKNLAEEVLRSMQ